MIYLNGNADSLSKMHLKFSTGMSLLSDECPTYESDLWNSLTKITLNLNSVTRITLSLNSVHASQICLSSIK